MQSKEMQGKTVLITGASSGIGKETARQLAEKGAQVLMVCRNADRGEQARQEIMQATNNSDIQLLNYDLSEMKNVREMADEIQQNFSKLDVLINNVGIMPSERSFTTEGHEHSWAVNHLSSFLLTNLLLDMVKAAGRARIINVSSEAHRLGQLNFHELHSPRRYSTFTAYCDSKLANVLFTYELTRQLEGTDVTANCLHPGMVLSNFGEDTSGIYKVIWNLTKPFMITPEEGAGTSVYLATSAMVAGVSGCYFKNKLAVKSSSDSYNERLAKRLWDISADHVQL